jgi:hypothetical protein
MGDSRILSKTLSIVHCDANLLPCHGWAYNSLPHPRDHLKL